MQILQDFPMNCIRAEKACGGKMEFRALVHMEPEMRATVRSFVGELCGDKFEFVNPYEELGKMDEAYSTVPAYFIVSEGEEVLAYGELQCVTEEQRFYVEFEGKGVAGTELIRGMCKAVKELGFVLMTPSSKEADELLMSAGMKCDSVDYVLVYEGEGTDTSVKLSEGYEFFDDEPDEDGGCMCGITDAEGYILSSCIVSEYADSICISGVFTDESYRRQGLATMLIQNIISVYEGKEVILHVYGENERAVSLYKKLGFVVKESLYTYLSV